MRCGGPLLYTSRSNLRLVKGSHPFRLNAQPKPLLGFEVNEIYQHKCRLQLCYVRINAHAWHCLAVKGNVDSHSSSTHGIRSYSKDLNRLQFTTSVEGEYKYQLMHQAQELGQLLLPTHLPLVGRWVAPPKLHQALQLVGQWVAPPKLHQTLLLLVARPKLHQNLQQTASHRKCLPGCHVRALNDGLPHEMPPRL